MVISDTHTYNRAFADTHKPIAERLLMKLLLFILFDSNAHTCGANTSSNWQLHRRGWYIYRNLWHSSTILFVEYVQIFIDVLQPIIIL